MTVSYDKDIVFRIFLIILTSAIMLIVRNKIDVLTPDEINFLQENYIYNTYSVTLFGGSGTLALKYYISTKIFQFFLSGGRNLLYIVNIILLVFTFYLSFKILVVKFGIVSANIWTILFIYPNTVFFSVSILRDIHIFFLCVLIITSYIEHSGLRLGGIFLCVVTLLIRPEIGFILILAVIINHFNDKIRKQLTVIYLLSSFTFMVYLFYETDFYSHKMLTYQSEYINSWGIYNDFSPGMENVYKIITLNILLYYFPLTNEYFLVSKLGNLFIISSLFNFYLIIKSLFKFRLNTDLITQKYQKISFTVLVLYIPFSANEYYATSAVRHVLPLLPFLFIFYSSLYYSQKHPRERLKSF